MSRFLDALRERVLLCDGGTGSRVQAMSLDVDRDYLGNENCTEVLVKSRPDIVREIHRGYLEAGADCAPVLQQLAALRGAVNGLMSEILESHVREQLHAQRSVDELAEDITTLVRSYLK